MPEASHESAAHADLPPALRANADILDVAELALARTLLKCGQEHLFEEWDPPGTNDDEKHGFFDQLASLDAAYPSGIEGYVARARTLLGAARAGDNPLKGWQPSLPPAGRGMSLDPSAAGAKQFFELEEVGLEEAVRLGFVVVAGGVGERLGFSGIKLALPTEISTGTTVLQLYCAHSAATPLRAHPELRTAAG